MSLIKKSDVKNYLSSQKRNGIHLYRPVSQPDATGFSGDQSRHADSNASIVVEETVNRPSACGLETPPTKTQLDSSHLVTLIDSKSAQA
jgi:hypothetical protein